MKLRLLLAGADEKLIGSGRQKMARGCRTWKDHPTHRAGVQADSGLHPFLNRQLTRVDRPALAWQSDGQGCRVGPGSFTPSLSQIPDLILSHHPARATARRLPPSTEQEGSSGRTRWPNPVAMTHPLRSSPITGPSSLLRGGSAPLRCIGTFGLVVVATCAFSLAITGQVLTFQTEAWSSFTLPTRRMPLGPYQDIARADLAGRVTPRF
jgi:hypothetical protein